METLRWQRAEWHLPHLRVSRHRIDPGGNIALHAHDFAEWFWIESGRLHHQLAGSATEELSRGDARFLRPGQGHRLAGHDGAMLVVASVPEAAWLALAQRHGGDPAWPWRDGARRLDDRQLAWLASAIADLPATRQDASDADWFVAGMLRVLRRTERPAGAPTWLAEAIARLSEPGRLRLGLDALVGLSGRSGAHLSRAVRRHYRCTASELVLRLRLDHAARELRLGSGSILAISQDCGFASLSHFYRSFRARFGRTPAVFRAEGLA